MVKLQGGDEDVKKAWKMICDVSRKEFTKIYDRLDIKNNEYGESFYNEMIPGLIEQLEKDGIITEDQGCK